MKTAALKLYSMGYEPIPLEPAGKRPLPREWQTLRGLSTEDLAALFEQHPGCNVGVLTGAGLVVIDLDEKNGVSGGAALAELQARLGPLPPTARVSTPTGGSHLYYRCDAAIRNSAGKLGPGVDVRGEGGQVVAPPSRVPAGEYEWGVARGMVERDFLPALPPRWVQALLDLQAERPAAPAQPAGRERIVTDEGREAGKRRARAYLAAMPPAVSGRGGHGQTFDAACRAVERCYDIEDAWEVLCEYNQRCQPFWGERDLRRKLDQALKKHVLGSANDVRPERAPPSIVPPKAGEPDPLDELPAGVNAAYEQARRQFKQDRGVEVEEAFPGEDPVAVLKREVRPPSGPGRPGAYLPKDYDLVDWHGQRPSLWVNDQFAHRPWRQYNEQTGEWTPGTGAESLDHELATKGLNKRSRETFRLNVRTVKGDAYDYASAERFTLADGWLRLNRYRPSAVVPAAGDWEPIRRVMLSIHGGNEEHVEWTLDWLAWVLQRVKEGKPAKAGVSIVFYGHVQGTGKGTFGKVLRALFGPANTSEIAQGQLDEQYTEWADGKLLIIANEVYSSDNRTQSTSNKLKRLITDDTFPIRRMYQAPVERPNVANLIFTSNDDRPVRVEGDDRRFTFFKCEPKPLDPALGALVGEDALANGPLVSAFAEHLLGRAITRFQRWRPLVTEAKEEVQYDTASSGEKFIADLRGQGFHSVAQAYRDEHGLADLYRRKGGRVMVSRRTLYAVYRSWCHAEGYSPLGQAPLYRLVRRLNPTEVQARFGDVVERCLAGLPGVLEDEPQAQGEATHENIERFKLVMGVEQ